MNKILSNKRLIVFSILIATIVLFGVEIASRIYYLKVYETVLVGIISATNLVFFYLIFMTPKSSFVSKVSGVKIKYPEDIKYIVMFFFLSIIMYWSLQFVMNAIVFLLRG